MIQLHTLKRIFGAEILRLQEEIMAAKTIEDINAKREALRIFENVLGQLDIEFEQKGFKGFTKTTTKELYEIVTPSE